MRILFIQPSNTVGGAEISLYQLVRSLRSLGFTFQVALRSPDDSPYVQMLEQYVEKVHALYLPTWQRKRVQGMKNKVLTFLARVKRGWYVVPTLRLARIIVKNRIDIVHTNGGLCPVGALAAFLTRRPHVWHVREQLGSDGLFPLALGDRTSANLFRRLSCALICNSLYTAEFFKRRGGAPRVIHNGVNLDEFENSAERGAALRNYLGLSISDPVVGMVGNVRSTIKEHELFLQAMALVSKEIPSAQFVIFGGSSDPNVSQYASGLRVTASRLQLSEHLTWAGMQSDIPAMMRSLDILVHPTSREGSGRVIMEAMAAGTPVVAVKSGGVQELLQHGATGYLVEPRNVVALFEATIELLGHSERRQQLGNAAKAYARKRFSHDLTIALIQAVYQEVVRNRTAARQRYEYNGI